MKYFVKNIVNFLESKFPSIQGEKWDHNGLIIGSIKSKVESILISLDLTTEVINEAISINASMILTHHPFLYEESIEKEFKKNPYKKDILNKLIDTGIAYYSLHTAYDVAVEGMQVGITNVLGIEKNGYTMVGKYGILLNNDKIPHFGALVNKLKNAFNVDSLNLFGDMRKIIIEKIGILPGSGDIESIIELQKQGASIIVTSDIKWSEGITMKELNIPVLAISHYIENAFVSHMKSVLNINFEDLDVYTININDLWQKV